MHAELVPVEKLQFEDIAHFESWLTSLSDNRDEQFVKKAEIANKDGILSMKYVCRASREAASTVSNRKERIVRAAESSKMKMNCLALIRSFYPNGLSG